MTSKILIAAALSLGLGTAVAMAQNDQLEPDAGAAPGAETTLPAGEAAGEAFFTDPATGALRTEEDVRANWQTLSEEQQAEVRVFCDTVDMAATPDDDMTTGSVTTDEVASIEQSCGWIEGM